MAVKGSATVTLSQYRDTESVTRYYKLQSSSMAAPDKPTSVKPNETPAGWSKSEPACDITKTLYTCDVTVFSDKTTHVSDVSKSTSYEAAKEAWNKANNAQGTANEAKKYTDNALNNYGYQYTAEIEVAGDPNTYYPVMIFGPGEQDVMREILVKRSFSDKAPQEWNGHPTKYGIGCTCKIKCNFGEWGGMDYDWRIHELNEMYGHAFGGCKTDDSGLMFFIFLRGGGAKYYLYSDMRMDGVFWSNPKTTEAPSIWYNGEMVGWKGGTAENPDRPFYAPHPRQRTDTVIKEIHDRTYIQVATDAYDKAGTAQNTADKAQSSADKAQNTATEAAKTADNYISADSTGIMVSENKGITKETPSNATKNNVLITEKDVQIRNGQDVIASYGKSAIIGKNESNNIKIKDNGFSINNDGNKMFAVEQEDTETNYIGEFIRATYDAGTDTCSLESSYKAYYPNRLPVLYVIHRDDTEGDVSGKETIQYGDTKLPCTVSITEAGKYLVKFKKTDWDKSWENMSPGLEINYYAVGGGAKVTIGTRTDYGLANNGSWSLTVGSSNTAENRSIAVGKNNRAKDDSVVIGNMAIARNSAIAVGSYAKATDYNSAAIGYHVRTDKMNQLIVGQYNRETTYSTLFAAGCGTDTEPANAAAITAIGDIRLKGTVYIGCEKDSSGGKSIVDFIYPVGSVYISVNSTDPGKLFGGTWQQIKDRFLLSAGDTYAAGSNGGSAKATLPSHTHTVGSGGYQLWGAKSGQGSTEPGNQISGDAKYYAAANGGSASNYKWLNSVDSKGVSDVSQANMPPYLAVYVWQRIS